MKKLINFIKKPLVIISAILFLVSTVGFVVVSTLSHGKTYVYDFDDSASEIIVRFEDKNTVSVETFVSFSETNLIEYEYKINKGKLMVKGENDTEWNYIGRVNAFELIIDYTNPTTGKTQALEFECETNEILQELCIAFMIAFGVIALLSLLIAVLDNYGLLKFLEKNSKPATEQSVEKNSDK